MILLIDGNNLLHRAHWVGQKNPLINSKQQNVTDTFHVLRMVKSYVEQFKATDIYMIWDHKLIWPSTNFRKEYKQVHQEGAKETNLDYKGTRDSSTGALNQEEMVWKALASLGVKNMFPGVLEADDVIAWLSSVLLKDNSYTAIIISADKDMYQLINDRVSVYNPLKKVLITPLNFEEQAEVPQEHFVTYKCIMGDVSDNIKGIRGYGPKKALALIKSGGLSELPFEQKDIVEKNRRVIDLKHGILEHLSEVPLYEQQLEKSRSLDFSLDAFTQTCIDLEFPSILNDMGSWEASFTGIFAQTKVLKLKNNP